MKITDFISVADCLCSDQSIAHQLLLSEIRLAQISHQMETVFSTSHFTDRTFRINDRTVGYAHVIGKRVVPVVGIVSKDRIVLQPVPCEDIPIRKEISVLVHPDEDVRSTDTVDESAEAFVAHPVL